MVRISKILRRVMYEDFAAAVLDLIKKENLWNKYLAPERDLSLLFGVSRETVRRGLSLLEGQGLLSRQQGRGTLVLQKKKGKKGKSDARIIIGSNQPGPGGGYSADIMAGLTESAGLAAQGLAFANLAVPAVRQKLLSDLSSGAVDGLLLLSVVDKALVRDLLRKWTGPTVLVDHHFDDLPITGVIDDGEGGARQVMDHLLSLGHKRVGYIEVARRELNPWRYAGYVGALADAGIAPDERLIIPSFSSFEAGRLAAEQLLSLRKPPTAILAFDDQRAWGAWRAAESMNLKVGGDLALAGFGDSAAKIGFPDELTSIRFDSREIGRLAFKELRNQMGGGGSRGDLITVPTELIVRESSGGTSRK